MQKRKITAAIAVATLVIGGAWIYRRAEANEAPPFQFAAVERGTVKSTVSATGTLNAERTVQVGTQVSGQIAAIHVDFNDRVSKGQLLARIDPTLQQQAVQDAQANLAKAQAQLELAKQEYDRNEQLYGAKIVTAAEWNVVQSNYAVAKANVQSAQISLQRARQNLAYTSIHAPIDGVVVERNVDVGQTVAASLSAPQLFLIANDLSQMEILASVDESDIGSIREGQPVTFTVQSFPNREFTGTVKQVRLQSATTDNVVSYTAVVTVSNPEGRLLPGMTATVKFETAVAENVLTVPTAALRFTPPDADGTATAAGGANASPTGAAGGQGGARPAGAQGARAGGRTGAGRGAGGIGRLWVLNEKGEPTAVRVRTGITDGQRTQVQAEGIAEGTRVIVGTGAATAAATGATNPFQQQQQGPRRPGGF